MDEARSLLAKLSPDANDEEFRKNMRAHDLAMTEIDLLGLDIREEESKLGKAPETNDRRPGGNGTVALRGDTGDIVHTLPRSRQSEEGRWSDERGNLVRVLGPADTFAVERAEPGALGNTLRAAITGVRNDVEKRALSIGTDSAGGFTAPESLAYEFIDKLRAKPLGSFNSMG